MNWRWILVTSLIAALAISYGVLNRNSDPADNVAATLVQPPVLYFKDAILTQTRPDGSVQVRLSANRIAQQSSNEDVSADTVRVDYLSPGKLPWTLTSDHGVMHGGTKIIDFTGNVLMRQQTETEQPVVRTDNLELNIDANTARTASPVAVQMGPHTVNATGLKADMNRGTVTLESQVNGRFEPK